MEHRYGKHRRYYSIEFHLCDQSYRCHINVSIDCCDMHKLVVKRDGKVY